MNADIFAKSLLTFGKKAAEAIERYKPQSGLALEIWTKADELFATGEAFTATILHSQLGDEHKISNVSVELSAWRKYHGIRAF